MKPLISIILIVSFTACTPHPGGDIQQSARQINENTAGKKVIWPDEIKQFSDSIQSFIGLKAIREYQLNDFGDVLIRYVLNTEKNINKLYEIKYIGASATLKYIEFRIDPKCNPIIKPNDINGSCVQNKIQKDYLIEVGEVTDVLDLLEYHEFWDLVTNRNDGIVSLGSSHASIDVLIFDGFDSNDSIVLRHHKILRDNPEQFESTKQLNKYFTLLLSTLETN